MHLHRAILFGISCLLAIINARAACVPAPSNLLAWYKGETATSDEVTQGRGTIRGTPTFVNGVSGQGFHFNGGKDAIVLNDNTPFRLQEFTIEAWIRRSRTDIVSDSPGGCAIFSSGAGGYSLAMTHEGSPAVSYVGVSRIDGPRVITDTNWHHVATTRSNKVVRIFVDGKLVQEGVQDVTYSFDTPFAIGSMGSDIGGTFYSFIGDIDEVSVYSGALAESDILKIYNAGSEGKCPVRTNCESPDGLVAYWSANNTTSEHLASLPGEIVGGTQFVEGVSGKAFRFDGQSDGVVIPNSERLQLQNFSIAMWIKRGDLLRTSYDFDGGALFAGGLGSYALAIQNNGTLCISNVGITRSCTGPAVTDLNWHHVAISKVNNQVTFFMDGIKRSTTTFDQTFEFSAPFGIGSVGGLVQGLWDSFWGDIDDVAVYSRAVTESEMLALTESRQPPVCLQDINIEFTSAPKLVQVNEDTPFKLRITNEGGQAATAVKIQWPLKAGQSLVRTSVPQSSCAIQDSVLRCDLGLLPGSSSLDLEFVYRFSEANPIEQAVTMIRGEPDASLENNIARTLTTVIGSCLPPLPGLVARWPGEGNTWDTFGSATAASTRTSFGPGVDSGQAFFFDGNTSIPVFDSASLRPPRFTWSMWVKPSSYKFSNSILISHQTASGGALHIRLAIQGNNRALFPVGSLLFGIGVPDWPNGPNALVGAPSTLALGEWTHVALTYETNGTAMVYVNGIATRDVKVAAQPAPSFGNEPGFLDLGGTGPVSIDSAPANRFEGSLDEITLYDRPLSAAEVGELYQVKTRLLCRNDLAVSWVDVPKTMIAGHSESLAVAVRNGGTDLVNSPKLRLSSAAGLPILRAMVNGTACPINNGVTECTIGDLPANTERIVRVFVRADGKPGPYNLSAIVSSSTPDEGPNNNTATASIEILGDCQPVDHLIAWWAFENSWTERAQGLTDNSNAVGLFAPGRIGHAVQFGVNFFLLETTLPGLPTDRLTVEGWIQRLDTTRSSPSDAIGTLIGSDGGAWNFSLSQEGALMFGSTGVSHVESRPVITDLGWHHVAVTLANGLLTLFADGEPVLSTPYSFTFQYPNPFNIGQRYTTGNGGRSPLLANLDELSVYSEALTPEQIRAIHGAGTNGKCFGDLALSVDPQATSVDVGGTFKLRFDVSNRGESVATGTRLRMKVPAGYTLESVLTPGGACGISNGLIQCDLGNLAPGAQMQVELELRTNALVTEFNLEPEVVSELPDSVPLNNRASVQLAVLGPCLEAPQGLVAWWRGEDNLSEFAGSNPTVVTQGSAPEFTQGRVGRAFAFNGDQGIGIKTSNSLATASLSIAAWVRPVSLNGTVEIIAVHERPSTPQFPAFALGIRGPLSSGIGKIREGQLCFQVGNVTGLPQDFNKWVDARASIPLNTWTFVALTVDADLHSVAVSVDGVETRRVEILTGTPASPTGGFYIGAHSSEAIQASFDYFWDRFTGGIDELMVFRRALSSSEIQALFSSGKRGACTSDLQLQLVSSPVLRVPLNQSFTAELQVTNLDSRRATRVTVTNTLPPFFQFISSKASSPDILTTVRGEQLITEFGTVAPTSTASVQYFFKASQGSKGQWTANLSSQTRDLNTSNNTFTRFFSTAPVEIEIFGNRSSDGPNEYLGVLEFEVSSLLTAYTPITVDYATQSGTATEGVDFIRTTGTLTIAPGQFKALIQVPILNDGIPEDIESFTVTLSNPRGAALKTSTATGYIINEASSTTLSIDDVTLLEGTGTPNTANFTVSLSNPSLVAVTVQYSTANGTARAGVDFTAVEGTLTFAPGETNKQVAVRIVPDGAQEPNEQFTVLLKNPTGASIGDAIGVATLLNDDGLAGQLAALRSEIVSQPVQPDGKFSIQVTALDASGNTLSNYSGAVSMSAHLGSGLPVGILLTEIFSDSTGNSLEFQNMGDSKFDISGWTVTLFDADRWPAPQVSFSFPADSRIDPRELLILTDRSTTVGVGIKNFTLGSPVRWTTFQPNETPRKIGVLLQDNIGNVRDAFFADGANPGELSVPMRLNFHDWNEAPVMRDLWDKATYSRSGQSHRPSRAGWAWATPSIGTQNPQLILPFFETIPLTVAPEFASEFVNGVYKGQVQVTPPATGYRIFVDDGNGHTGISSPVITPLVGDISLQLQGPTSVIAGTAVEYVAQIRNPGPTSVGPLIASVKIQGNISETTAFFGSNSHGSIPTIQGSPGNWVVNATLSEIPPNTTAEVRFSLNSDRLTQVTGFASAIAQISKASSDPNELNNSAELRTEISQPPYAVTGAEFAWWSASDNARDLIGQHHGTLAGPIQIGLGRVGPGFNFTGPGAAFIVHDSRDLNLFPENSISIDFWLRTDAPNTRARVHLFSKRDSQSGAGYEMTLNSGIPEFALYSPLPGNLPVLARGSQNRPVNDGQWHHVAVAMERAGPSGRMIMIVDGVNAGVNTAQARADLSNNAPLYFGAPATDTGISSFVGELDEITFSHQDTLFTAGSIFVAGSYGRLASTVDANLSVPVPLGSSSNGLELPVGVQNQPYHLRFNVQNQGPRYAYGVRLQLQFSTAPNPVLLNAGPGGSSQALLPTLWELRLPAIPPGLAAPVAVQFTSQASDQFIEASLISDSPNQRVIQPQALHLRFDPDSDGDGMDDDYEFAHGFNPGDPADGALDSDGDGANNATEFRTGTSPLDPDNFLELQAFHSAEVGINLEWVAQPQRFYQIVRKLSLADTTWEVVAEHIGTEIQRLRAHDATPPEGNAWYTIRVLP